MRMLANQERCLACKKVFYTAVELTRYADSGRPVTCGACQIHRLPMPMQEMYVRNQKNGDKPVTFELYENGRWLIGHLGHPDHCSMPCYVKTQDLKRAKKAVKKSVGYHGGEIGDDHLLNLAMVDEAWMDERVFEPKSFRDRRVIPPKRL